MYTEYLTWQVEKSPAQSASRWIPTICLSARARALPIRIKPPLSHAESAFASVIRRSFDNYCRISRQRPPRSRNRPRTESSYGVKSGERGTAYFARCEITSLRSEMNRARDAREGLHLIPRYAVHRHRLSIPLPTDRQEGIFIPAPPALAGRASAFVVVVFVAPGKGARKTAGGSYISLAAPRA